MPTLRQLLLDIRRRQTTPQEIRKALNLKTPSLRAVSLTYSAFLVRFQIELNKEIRKQIQPIKKEVLRHDALSDDPIDAVFKAIAELVAGAIGSALLLTGANNAADRTEAVNFRKYDKGVYEKLGINATSADLTQEMIDNWVKTNVGLITKANANQLGALEALFRDSAFSGIRAGQLNQQINKIFGGTRNNVKVIARDQIGKLGGQLDRLKQTEAGIDGYYWRTSRDERVRPLHAHREGIFFSWDKPPPDGHPGHPIGCRCDAEPALDKALLSRKEFEEAKRFRDSENKRKREEALRRSRAVK